MNRIELAERLDPVLEEMVLLDPPRIEAYLIQIQFRFGLKSVEIAAYRRMLRHKEKDREDPTLTPRTVMTADFPGLIDLVLDDGRVKFLVRDGSDLLACETYEHDGVNYIPPPQPQIPWMLPRYREVRRWFKADTDERLHQELVDYHRGISELPSEAFYELIAA